MIIIPNDTISAQKHNNASWAAIGGENKISKKANQGTKGNASGLIHRRSYADIASNDAGPYYFISLQTGRRINRRSWTSLPMLEAVVSQVHCLARRAKAAKKLTFTNSDNEDLDVLYVDLERDKDDIELELGDVQPTRSGR